MIKIAYCNLCIPKAVKAAGMNIVSCNHDVVPGDDTVQHDCVVINDIDEPEFVEGVKMKDDTIINSSDEYLTFLDKYIP